MRPQHKGRAGDREGHKEYSKKYSHRCKRAGEEAELIKNRGAREHRENLFTPYKHRTRTRLKEKKDIGMLSALASHHNGWAQRTMSWTRATASMASDMHVSLS